MDGEDKLVFIGQRIESLEMLVGTLVHLGQFEVEVVPMDAFHTALPFLQCLLTAFVMKEHNLHIIEQPDGHLLLAPCTENVTVFRFIAGDEPEFLLHIMTEILHHTYIVGREDVEADGGRVVRQAVVAVAVGSPTVVGDDGERIMVQSHAPDGPQHIVGQVACLNVKNLQFVHLAFNLPQV